MLTGAAHAQQAPAAGDASRSVAGGGIKAPGWSGIVDPDAAKTGQTVNDDKFVKSGDTFAVMTGPAVTYWNPANKVSGDYIVSATFTEPKFMNLNTHPHPYGVVIAGNDMGTGQQSYLYCAAYGNGSFIVRGFGPDAFQLNGRRGMSDAVHKAAGPGEPVTQEVAMQVKGDSISCLINGTVVATYPKADLVVAGKLKATDGVWGLRFAHNTEVNVTAVKVTKP
jgi:hypothetical protein